MFMPLFCCPVNQLLIRLISFTGDAACLQERHNYVTAQRILNQLCQNQININWPIQLRIFT